MIGTGTGEHTYSTIFDHYRILIDEMKLSQGEKLPTEKEMTEFFNVKRFTVRKAISRLIDEGYIYPIRNKGYYVSFPKITIKIRKDSSYTKSMLKKGIKPKVKMLEIRTVSPTPEQKEIFGFTLDEKLWEIVVLRYYREIPFLIGRSYIPFHRAPEFNLHYKKIKSIHKVLEDIYGIFPIRKHSKCTTGISDRKESRYLAIYDGSPLFRVESINAEPSGSVIEQCFSTYRADIVSLSFNP